MPINPGRMGRLPILRYSCNPLCHRPPHRLFTADPGRINHCLGVVQIDAEQHVLDCRFRIASTYARFKLTAKLAKIKSNSKIDQVTLSPGVRFRAC